MVDETHDTEAGPVAQGDPSSAASSADWSRLLHRIYWPRIFAEGLAIIVSILLAFAVNAWWENAQSRRGEAAILRGLREDFEASLVEIDRARSRVVRLRDGATALLDLTGPASGMALTADANRLLIDLLQGGATYRPVSGTLGALLSSEGLSVVASSDLRDRLASWTQLLDEIQLYQEQMGSFYTTEFMPYLYERIPVRTLDAMADPDGPVGASRFPVELTDMLTDLEFENLVNEVLFSANLRLTTLDRATTLAEEIIRVIDAELDR